MVIATALLAGIAAPAVAVVDVPRYPGVAFKTELAPLTAPEAAAATDEAAPAATVAATTVRPTAMVTTSVKAQAIEPVKASGVTAAGAKTTAYAPTKASTANADELGAARAILAGLMAKYPILQGTTVSFGDARGYQAIALYKSGRIIISPSHTATLERILNHEIWHIIDWRDNGSIDWGEQVPPQ